MDLARWKLYDGYLQQMKSKGLLAYMSLFEDGKPGNYGDLPEPGGLRIRTDRRLALICALAHPRVAMSSREPVVAVRRRQTAQGSDSLINSPNNNPPGSFPGG